MTYDFAPLGFPAENRFALRLRMIRSGAGLTPHALAQRADMDVNRYQAFESGHAKVTAAALVRLSAALQLNPSLFFDPD